MNKLANLRVFVLTILLSVSLSNTAYAADVWSSMGKLTASDGAGNDYFGESVSIDGDYAVVGAWGDDDNEASSGSAYIFKYENGIWTEQAKLTPSGGESNDRFGNSVSISGDYALIGDLLDNNYSGAAYVFVRNGTNWTQQAKLVASDGAGTFDRFGSSVSICDDYAVIGAVKNEDNGRDSGAAYIFKRSGTAWSQQAKLMASDAAADDQFGCSVSISGNFAVIGAWANDDSGSNSGSAYVFKLDGTIWAEQAKLIAVDGAANDKFGYSVSISNDSMISGAFGDDGIGSAYVFKYDGASWQNQGKLTAPDGTAGDEFGSSVSISGGNAIVGTWRDDDNGSGSGSAYTYAFDGTAWAEQDKLTADDGVVNDGLGKSVSISGNTSIVGANLGDGEETDSGSAYVFEKLTLCPVSDLSGDCFVDISDFAIMAGEWLTGDKIAN